MFLKATPDIASRMVQNSRNSYFDHIQKAKSQSAIFNNANLNLRMFKMIKVNIGRRKTQSQLSVNDHKQEECGKSINKSHESLHAILSGNGNEERQLKMADSISSSTDDWEGFFQSLVDLLNDCETSSVTTSATRETIAVRLEHPVLPLQQILPLVPGGSECGAFLRALKQLRFVNHRMD